MLTIRASSAYRAFNCAGSVRLEGECPPRAESDDAKEGTACHWVAESVLTNMVASSAELIDRFAPNGVCITAEMADCADVYIDYVRSLPGELSVERQIEFDVGALLKITGTSDSFTYDLATDNLIVNDLKYGYRIVEPEENWQLLCYAIGAAYLLGKTPQCVTMSIIQPRPFHADGKIRSWRITGAELNDRFLNIIEIAKELNNPNAMLKTGTHCQYCAAFATCTAVRTAGYNAVDVAVRGINNHISDIELGDELHTMIRAKALIDARHAAIEEMVKERLKTNGNFPGWSLKQSFGHTKWVDTVDISMLEAITGKTLTEKKPVSPTTAKKLGVPDELLNSLTTRPIIGTKLTPINVDKKAKELFK